MRDLIAIEGSIFLSFIFRKFWSTLLLASIVLLTMLYSCGRIQEEGGDIKQKSEAFKVVVFGGTITEGTSAKLDVSQDCFKWGTTDVNMVRKTQTWGAIMERILRDWVDGGVEVISAGSVGNTASKGAARLENDVLSHSPDYVLVMFGMDDAIAGVETDKFRVDLEKIVNRIEEEKANVFLVTPPPISERMTINCTMDELRLRQAHLSGHVQAIRDLAEKKKMSLIDFYQYFLDNRLAYDHLFEGWLPDAVAQSAMAPFAAGELLPLMGVNNYPNPVLSGYRKAYTDTSDDLDWRHNAFTDLTYFQGQFYLTFRNAASHATPPPSGRVIVLRSFDGIFWEREAILVVSDEVNHGDPKFFKVDGRLFVTSTNRFITKPTESRRRATHGFERLDAGEWSDPFLCAPGIGWRPKKWRDQYVAAYYLSPEKDAAVKLFSSKDGRNWNVISKILPSEADANETDLLVENDRLTAFSRAEKASNSKMLISTYFPDENRWETVSTGRIIHAPCVFTVGDRTMVAGRYCSQSDDRFRELQGDWRKFCKYVQKPDKEGSQTVAEATGVDLARIEEYHHGLRTGIFVIDGTRPRLVMELLSAGDSSYPGVAEYGDEYVISDYSMHEYYPEIKRPHDWRTPADIYISRIRFGK